jgi:hypothetical protein
MAQQPLQLRPLLLLESGRLAHINGLPKHLLPMSDGRPLYQQLVDVLHAACPESSEVYVALDWDSLMDQELADAMSSGALGAPESPTTGGPKLKIIFNLQDAKWDGSEVGGPAPGLLAAYNSYPQASWLVASCDFPYLTADALNHLRSAYIPPVTCFRHPAGACEPAVGVWSPAALSRLAEKGTQGPGSVVRRLGGMTIMPEGDVLSSIETRKDWEQFLRKTKKASE